MFWIVYTSLFGILYDVFFKKLYIIIDCMRLEELQLASLQIKNGCEKYSRDESLLWDCHWILKILPAVHERAWRCKVEICKFTFSSTRLKVFNRWDLLEDHILSFHLYASKHSMQHFTSLPEANCPLMVPALCENIMNFSFTGNIWYCELFSFDLVFWTIGT